MRDPNRIDEFCDTLKEVWKMVPDWRFGQFVVNVFGADPFYIEDDKALKWLKDRLISNPTHIEHGDDQNNKNNWGTCEGCPSFNAKTGDCITHGGCDKYYDKKRNV